MARPSRVFNSLWKLTWNVQSWLSYPIDPNFALSMIQDGFVGARKTGESKPLNRSRISLTSLNCMHIVQRQNFVTLHKLYKPGYL